MTVRVLMEEKFEDIPPEIRVFSDKKAQSLLTRTKNYPAIKLDNKCNVCHIHVTLF